MSGSLHLHRIESRLRNANMVVSAHTVLTYLVPDMLSDFLSPRCKSFLYVMHPFEYRRFESTCAQEFSAGQMSREIKLPRIRAPAVALYAKDLIMSIIFVLHAKKRFHIFIGADPLNTLAGLVLRKMGFAAKVVFWAIDFSPRRLQNRTLNYLYHFLERLVVSKSDYTWCLSREIARMLDTRSPRKLFVAYPGIVPCNPMPAHVINRTRLAYTGTLTPEKGLDLVIDAMPLVLKECSRATLVLIGSGPLESQLRKRVSDMGLDRAISFTGYLPSVQDVCSFLRESAIGIAPYSSTYYEPYSFPGKVTQYMACGLPVIMTRISELADEVEQGEAGIVLNEGTPQELAAAVSKLLLDDDLYGKYRENAIHLSRKYETSKQFLRALDLILSEPT